MSHCYCNLTVTLTNKTTHKLIRFQPSPLSSGKQPKSWNYCKRQKYIHKISGSRAVKCSLRASQSRGAIRENNRFSQKVAHTAHFLCLRRLLCPIPIPRQPLLSPFLPPASVHSKRPSWEKPMNYNFLSTASTTKAQSERSKTSLLAPLCEGELKTQFIQKTPSKKRSSCSRMATLGGNN